MFWLGAVVSLCYVPGVTGAYIATQWPVLAVVLCFGLLRRGPFTVFHVLGVLFIAYAAARLPWSPNIQGSVFGLWLAVIMALAVWFGTTLTDARELYAGLAIGGAVSSLLAVLQYFGVATVPTASAMPAGLYVNSVQQGTVLALIVVALSTERMWFWALPLLPGIWLAHSRGGFLVLLLGLFGRFAPNLWVAGVPALAVGAFFLLNPLSSSDEQRTLVWRAAWDGLTWLGWGTGVFYNVMLSQNNVVFFPEYVHNDFLQLALEYGLAAALIAGIIGYAAWRSDLKEWPIVLAFCAAACFSMPMFMPIASFLGFVAMGRILREHGLHGWNGDPCRRLELSRYGFGIAPRRANVSVAPRYSTEG